MTASTTTTCLPGKPRLSVAARRVLTAAAATVVGLAATTAVAQETPTTRPVDLDNPYSVEAETADELPMVVDTSVATGFFERFTGMFGFGDNDDAATVVSAVEEIPTEMINADQIDGGRLRVTVNDTRVVKTSRPYTRVAIGRDDLADIRPLGPRELLVTAKRPGTTQVVFWDENDESQTLLLHSGADVRAAQSQHWTRTCPAPRFASPTSAGTLPSPVGLATSKKRTAQMSIVGSFAQPENLLDMAGGQQVALRIRFAEVTRNSGKQFGVNFGFTDGSGTIAGSRIGQISPLSFFRDTAGAVAGIGIPDPNTGAQIFGLATSNGDPLAYYVNALRESNLLRVLADPELVVASGEEGEFLAGGEYPIPVPQEEGIAIEYRDFGIRLAYAPVVMGDGRIRMRLRTEVSDLDDTIASPSAGPACPDSAPARRPQSSRCVTARAWPSVACSGATRRPARAPCRCWGTCRSSVPCSAASATSVRRRSLSS